VSLCKNLYKCQIDDLRGFAEKHEPELFARAIHSFNEDKTEAEIARILTRAESFCTFPADYDIYLQVGFGHIDGTALPAEKPFLYFGIERYESLKRLSYLAAHEYNHMLRISALGIANIFNMLLAEMVITEGLVVISSWLVSGNGSEET